MTIIELNNIFNSYNQKKNKCQKHKLSLPDDKFVKGKNMEEDIRKENIIKVLCRSDYNRITNALTKDNYWTDSVNFIGFNKKNNKIDSVSIGLLNPEKADTDVSIISVDDFINLFTDITANKIEKSPDEEKNYKNSFVDLLTHISKNRTRD